MNWLARLKQQAHPLDVLDTCNPASAPQPDATEPTKPGSVGFVAPMLASVQKTGAALIAANDPAGDAVGKAHDPDRWAWPYRTARRLMGSLLAWRYSPIEG